MKILELCLSPNFGGLEIFVCRVVEALASNHRIITVTLPESPVRARLWAGGYDVEPLRTWLPRFPLLAAKRLAAMIDQREIDLVHVNWGPDLTLAALAKRLSRRQPRLVFTRHMLMTRPKRDPYHDFVYGQFDLILAVTREMERGLRRYLSFRHLGRIGHLYSGVPAPDVWLDSEQRKALRHEQGLPAQAFLVGIFSRLEAAKGQHLLLDAIAMLRDAGITICGLLVGKSMNDDYAKGLRGEARALGLEGQIAFCDFVEQPQLLMQTCDCVVLPTDRETFGLVLIEAMRCGVAVIGSEAGGVPEIIEHGVSGLLFESGNSRDLARQLRHLHDDPARRVALARTGRERAEEMFSSENQLPKLEELLQRLVDGDLSCESSRTVGEKQVEQFEMKQG